MIVFSSAEWIANLLVSDKTYWNDGMANKSVQRAVASLSHAEIKFVETDSLPLAVLIGTVVF
jgi:hypothetical protein